MKKHWKIFRKNSMEIFRNFPEKYEIFWTNFPPHITTLSHRRNLASVLKVSPSHSSVSSTRFLRENPNVSKLILGCHGIDKGSIILA